MVLKRIASFSRRPIAVAMLIVLMLFPASVATGQDGNQHAPNGPGQPLDLAAMVLVPTDVDIPGIGIGTGMISTIDQVVPAWIEATGLDPDETSEDTVKEQLLRRWWLRQYVSLLLAPVEVGVEEPTIGHSIIAEVSEFRSITAADVYFHELYPVPDWTESSQTIGDESVVFGPERGSDGSNFTRMVTFRIDNLIARVSVRQRGSAPSDSLMESLALTFLDRIEQVKREGGPSLSTRIVRSEPDGAVPHIDNYIRLGEASFSPYYLEDAGDIFSDTPYAEAADAYFLAQNLATGGGETSDDAGYTSILLRFPDEAAAKAWLANGQERVTDFGAWAGWKITPIPSAPTIGEESMTFGIEGESRDGHLIYVRVEHVIAQVHILALPGTPVLEGVQELAMAQAACLRTQELCDPVPVPASLVQDSGPATPPASPPTS
jgi:hypothetical protein